jgi:hypothetical protein
MGRPAGVPNKNKRGLLVRLQKELGKDYNPVIEMARIVGEVDANGDYVHDATVRFDMHDKIAPYVVPKLKALDINLEADIKTITPVLPDYLKDAD